MSDRALRLAVAALALAGAAIAGYLTYAWYGGDDVALCLTGGGCETVQDSRYAKLVGIPVPVLGLAGYGSILALAVVDGLRSRVLAAGLAAGGLAFSLYLLVLQLVVIDAVCSWCVGNDVVIALLTVATFLRIRPPDGGRFR